MERQLLGKPQSRFSPERHALQIFSTFGFFKSHSLHSYNIIQWDIPYTEINIIIGIGNTLKSMK